MLLAPTIRTSANIDIRNYRYVIVFTKLPLFTNIFKFCKNAGKNGRNGVQSRHENIVSELHCAQLCRDTLPCLAFSYKKKMGTCKLHYLTGDKIEFGKSKRYAYYEMAALKDGNHNVF